MISLNYGKNVVGWVLLRDQAGGEPSAAALEAKDQQLKQAFEQPLNDILPQFGLEPNKRVKSLIVLLSHTSAGGSTRNRVRNACRFFVKLREL